MNRNDEYTAMIEELNQPFSGLDATYERASKRLKRRINAWLSITITICIILCILPYIESQPAEHPLVIKAHAIDMDGHEYIATLSLSERVQLSPASSYLIGDYECYAFDLSLIGAKYLSIYIVGEDWIFYPDTSVHYYAGEEDLEIPYWAYSEGDELSFIIGDIDKKAPEGYKDGTLKPFKKGSSLIWRVNSDNMTRCVIDCYDADFNFICTYRLQIIESDEVYYAEIADILYV